MSDPEPTISTSDRLRSLRKIWQLSAFGQFMWIFGEAILPEDFDYDDFESAIVQDNIQYLLDLRLILLKRVSSNRHLTLENADEYTRRQFLAKKPSENPFGDDIEPKSFASLSDFDKECIENREDVWRVDTIGYDNKGYMYYIFDNSYLYRSPDPEFPYRHAKKRKRGQTISEESELAPIANTWECIATSVEEYEEFADGLNQTKGDEKQLYLYLVQEAIPEITQVLENRRIEKQKKQEALARAPPIPPPFRERSSRISARDAARRELEEKERKAQGFVYRKSRYGSSQPLKTREQRLRERELRILRQESTAISTGNEVDNQSLKEAASPVLLQPKDSEGDWEFSCICGVKGENFDDGTLSVACEECNVWQHVACQGEEVETAIRKLQADYLCFRCSKSGKPEVVAPKESKDDDDDYEEVQDEEPEPSDLEEDIYEESDDDYQTRKSPKRHQKSRKQEPSKGTRPVFGGYIQQPANGVSYPISNHALYIQHQQALLAHQRYLQSQGYPGFSNQPPIRPNSHFAIPQNSQFAAQCRPVPYVPAGYTTPLNPYLYQQNGPLGPRPNLQVPQLSNRFSTHSNTPISPRVLPVNGHPYPIQHSTRLPYAVPPQTPRYLYQQPIMHSPQQQFSRPHGNQNFLQNPPSEQWKNSRPEDLTNESIKKDLLGSNPENI